LLRDGVSPEEVEAVLPTYVKKYRAESKNVHHYKLQPLADVHFNPKYDGKISKTVAHILWIFGKEFPRLVFIAFLVAVPVGWWPMSRWLENYAYRVRMAWWIFGLEVVIILVLVIITVGYQSVKTALANPVRSLRVE
jgi:hypothetical protein